MINLKIKNLFLVFVLFFYTADKEKCDNCGSLTPKKSKPEVEPRTPVKEPEKSEPQKKTSVFQRMGSFLKKKSKDDSPSKK